MAPRLGAKFVLSVFLTKILRRSALGGTFEEPFGSSWSLLERPSALFGRPWALVGALGASLGALGVLLGRFRGAHGALMKQNLVPWAVKDTEKERGAATGWTFCDFSASADISHRSALRAPLGHSRRVLRALLGRPWALSGRPSALLRHT